MIRRSKLRLWRQLLPAYIFTTPIVIGTYCWALLVHFSDSINNDSGNIFSRFVIITTLHIGVYGALFLSKQILLDRVRAALVPALTLVTLILIGAARGFFLENWLYALDITNSLDLNLRMGTSLINTVSSFSVAIIATAQARNHQLKNAHLLNELERLASIKLHALAGIKAVDSRAVENIKAELDLYVNSMQGRSVSELLTILREMIDKVVQPLSRRIENEPNLWVPPAAREVKFHVDWYKAFKAGLYPGKINYALIPLLMIFSSLPTVLKNTPLTLAFFTLILTYCTGLLVGKIFKSIFTNNSVNHVLYLLVTLLSGFAMGLTSLLMTSDYKAPFGFLILGTIFYPVTASIISMVANADEQIVNDTKGLALATQELEWNIARIRETQHQNQRNLARALHGSVQAKLASSYLELERISLMGGDASEKLDQIIAQIRGSIAGIDTLHHDHDDLPKVMAKTQENWASLAEISYQVSDRDLAMIQRDPLCAFTLFDAIPELVFNAIKHGKASSIHISVGFKNERSVELTVRDNGLHELVEMGSGLGTKILNESTLSWGRERHNAHTITKAEFAFSTNLQSLN